jgi:hypothetical protein
VENRVDNTAFLACVGVMHLVQRMYCEHYNAHVWYGVLTTSAILISP